MWSSTAIITKLTLSSISHQRRSQGRKLPDSWASGWYRCLLMFIDSSQAQGDNHIQWIPGMIWIPKVVVNTIVLSLAFWEFCYAPEKPVRCWDSVSPLQSSSQSPTSPLFTCASERAPQLFKHQPGQGQHCEMVTRDSRQTSGLVPAYDGIDQGYSRICTVTGKGRWRMGLRRKMTVCVLYAYVYLTLLFLLP